MTNRILLAALLGGILLWHRLPASPQPQNDVTQPEGQSESEFVIPEEEKPFWDSAQAFLDAYANRDSAAIGEMFTEDAEFLDEFGVRTQGRDNIVAMFQEVFDTSSGAAVEEIIIERVRPITDDVVVEEGTVVASASADSPSHTTRYVALHKKGSDGKWRINTLKDFPREAGSRQEQLEQMTWFIGEWVNQDEDGIVHTECDWSDDGNYLLRRFTVQTFDGREMSGVQRIGWDSAHKKLRSWTFDSEGGFFNGLWTQQGAQWLLTIVGVTAQGETVTGTAVYTVIDSEMITWHYRNLIIGNQIQEDSEPVTMVKRPPAPTESSN